MSSSVVTVTVFRYKPDGRFRAFANMGRHLMNPVQAYGLRFCKLMGSGINFGLIPDFSTYVFLAIWENEAAASGFPRTALYQYLCQGTNQVGTLYLHPLRSHGLWDGHDPFEGMTQNTWPDSKAPVAVLTRATIRMRALADFWRHVPQTRQRLQDHRANLLFGIGVGEVPLVQQATISVWRSADAVEQFAYRQSGHKEVVRLARQRTWFREELFARFMVLRAEGTLFADIQHIMSSI